MLLQKLNKLCKSLITEETEDIWFRQITKDNEFLKAYLIPLALKTDVFVQKARMNTFRVSGIFKNISEFFTKLKVDTNYLEKPEEFFIYSPTYSFNDNEYAHLMNRDEGFPEGTVDPYSTLAVNNRYRYINFGRWYIPKIIDKTIAEYPIPVKTCVPKDLIKFLKADETINDDTVICIEFQLNCENYANQCFDMFSQYIPEGVEEQAEIEKAEVNLEMEQPKEKNEKIKAKTVNLNKLNKVTEKEIEIYKNKKK